MTLSLEACRSGGLAMWIWIWTVCAQVDSSDRAVCCVVMGLAA